MLSITEIYTCQSQAYNCNLMISIFFTHRKDISFKGLDILELLSKLSSKSYSSIIPSKDENALYMEGLIFMMRHDLVHQLQVYICELLYTLCNEKV